MFEFEKIKIYHYMAWKNRGLFLQKIEVFFLKKIEVFFFANRPLQGFNPLTKVYWKIREGGGPVDRRGAGSYVRSQDRSGLASARGGLPSGAVSGRGGKGRGWPPHFCAWHLASWPWQGLPLPGSFPAFLLWRLYPVHSPYGPTRIGHHRGHSQPRPRIQAQRHLAPGLQGTHAVTRQTPGLSDTQSSEGSGGSRMGNPPRGCGGPRGVCSRPGPLQVPQVRRSCWRSFETWGQKPDYAGPIPIAQSRTEDWRVGPRPFGDPRLCGRLSGDGRATSSVVRPASPSLWQRSSPRNRPAGSLCREGAPLRCCARQRRSRH